MIKISQAYMCLLVEDLCGFKKREYPRKNANSCAERFFDSIQSAK